MTRYQAVGLVARLRKALAPVAVGFMLASGMVMTRAAYAGLLSLAIVRRRRRAGLCHARVAVLGHHFAGALVGIAAYLVAG